MNKETKLILLFILSIGIGSLVIIFQKEIISGIIIIFGGMSLSASDYFGWFKKLYSWLSKLSGKEEHKPAKKTVSKKRAPKKSNQGTKTVINQYNTTFGDHTKINGDVASGGSKIDKR